VSDLLVTHTRRWGFRARGPFEGAQQYREAAIVFLESRDWAAAHEVRLDKPQADWTPAEAQAFADRLNSFHTRPRDERPAGAVFVEVGQVPCTIEGIREVAAAGLDELAKRRRAHPAGELPIFAHILRLDGMVGLTTVSGHERLRVLRTAARTVPLYGYALVFDAYLHAIADVGGASTHATKREALLAHVGTRDDRLILQRPYTVVGRRVTFQPEHVIDVRASNPDWHIHDPYAELFVSVPAPARPQ
jgi:hypothetical protein